VLVGRARQVGQLRALVDALAEGSGGLVLVAGEAGIGKTRLAEEAMDLAEHAGAEAHRATCWAEAGAPPFWPWSQLLGALGAEPLVVSADESDHDLARFQLFSRVVDTLRTAAAERPRVLVLDDLHWADAPSVRLLAFLAPALRDIRVLVVATYRDTETSGAGDLAAVLPELVRHGRQLVVPPLDREELGIFVTGIAGEDVSVDLISRLFVLTRGNPLFAREVVSLLDAQGALGADTSTELPVPESVRATLARRLDTVSPECRESLGIASVLGVEFGIDVVVEMAGLDRSALLARLDEAHGARLVTDAGGGRFAFTHPLIRETAYQELGLARRVRLHTDAAEALERLVARGTSVEPAELAHHFWRGSPGGSAPKAVIYDEAAGRRAMAMLAYEAAVAHFEHALDALTLCPPDPEQRADLLLQLGDARVATGDRPQARWAFDEAATLARAQSRSDQLARAALGYGSGAGGFEVPPFDAPQIELVREALLGLGEADPATRSRLLARLSVARALEDSDTERLALADEAVSLARDSGDERALAYALAAHCDVISGPAFCEQRVRQGEEIVTLTRGRGDVVGELLGHRLRVLAFAELGRFGEMDAEVDAYARISDAIRQPLYAWYVPLWRGMRALMDGRYQDSIDRCAEAEAIGARAHSENAELLTFSLGASWMLFTGYADETYELCRKIMAGVPAFAFMMQPGLALAAARAGRLDDARTELRRVDLTNRSEWGAEWLPAFAQACEAAALCGDTDRAASFYAELLPLRHLFVIDGIAATNFGSVEHPLGMLAACLGRRDAARAHFDAALAAHRAAHSPVLVEKTVRDREQFLGATDELARSRSGSFRREGDVWALSYEGRTARLRHTKGIADIARLVSRPGTEVHVLDLAGDGRTGPSGGTGPQLDGTARDAYKRRLVDLEAEIDAADVAADAGRSEQLHSEREALLGELSSAYGLGGRARPTGDPAERARSAVTQRVRDALGRIEAEHPELGAHLRRAVRTGGFCVYEPDGPVEWEVVSQP
jgi:tetratricopeptide (TPR) repeat protein